MSSFYSIPGAAGTIQVGTVTKLAPTATPTVTNSGTAQAAILNFGIPQGDAGLVSAANQGTAAAPGISFAADTNTGLYNPAADTIGISTNGAGRLTIDATAQPAKEVLNSVFYPLVTQADIGGAANQLSLNGMLGGMAFQSPEGIAVDRAVVQGTGVGVTSETPLLSLTGAWYSGGTSTTTKPELLIEPAGTTSTGWSTSGTGLGINAASGFAGRLIDAQTNGVSVFNVDATGRASVPLGTAALPSIYPGTDTNTGIYSPAADTLAWSTGGSERARIDSSGRLLTGTSTSRSAISQAAQFQLEGTSMAGSSVSLIYNGNDTSAARLTFGKSRGTTIGGNTVVQSGDNLGAIWFSGANGTDLSAAGASIIAAVDGTVSGGGVADLPGRLVFSTTADGAATPTERMRIKSTGIINIANTPTYADNAAATTGGLAAGDVYRTSTGQLMIRY